MVTCSPVVVIGVDRHGDGGDNSASLHQCLPRAAEDS
jgi:hypothetical protein